MQAQVCARVLFNLDTTEQRVNLGTNTQLFVYKLQFGNFPRNKRGSPQGGFAACPLHRFRGLIFAYRPRAGCSVAGNLSFPTQSLPRSDSLSRGVRSIFGRKSDEKRAKCDCIACCIRLWRVGAATAEMISAPSRSVGSARLAEWRRSTTLANAFLCPLILPLNLAIESCRPRGLGKHRGSAGFSRSAPGD